LIEHLDFQIGGGGTNTATTFARQGLKTGYLGKLGEDPAGYAVKNFLMKERIDFLGIAEGQTGYSVILDSEEDDRTILTYKGANNELQQKEIKERLATVKTKWLYCSSMLGDSYETMLHVMKKVQKQRGRVVFNPSSYQAKEGLGTLQRVLDHVNILILNKEEAEELVGHQSNDTTELLHILAAAGPEIVIITKGKDGASLFDGKKVIHIAPSHKLKIVETTGAGDAFASGFVAGQALGYDLHHSMALGMKNAESVISHYGAKNNILTRKQTEKILENFLKVHDLGELK
jgi:ribokinase